MPNKIRLPLGLLGLTVAAAASLCAADTQPPARIAGGTPEVLLADPRVRLSFGEERLVIQGGLQPSMLITRDGSIVVQSQLPDKPFPGRRIAYHSALATVVSRDVAALSSPPMVSNSSAILTAS